MPKLQITLSLITPKKLIPRLTFLGVTLLPTIGVLGACGVDEDSDEIWVGEERGASELIPDETPSFVDEAELREVFGDEALDDEIDGLTAEPDTQHGSSWTGWYDRDNPSGNGDYESRHLQSGVCSTPTGVECRTVGGLALWDTGELVSCSAMGGLVCVNADQPDGECDYDYKVRFLCPDDPGGPDPKPGICAGAGGICVDSSGCCTPGVKPCLSGAICHAL